MQKKIIMCFAALILFSGITVLAEEPTEQPTVVRFEVGSPYFSINGEMSRCLTHGREDTSPFICPEFNRVMILNGGAWFRALGINLSHSNRSIDYKIFLTRTHQFEMLPHGYRPEGMGNMRMLRPGTRGGVTFVPLREIAEGIGADVAWDSGAVYITLYAGQIPPPQEGAIPVNINRRGGNEDIIFMVGDAFLLGEEVLIGMREIDYHIIVTEVSVGEHTLSVGGFGSLLRFRMPEGEAPEEVTVTLIFLPFRYSTHRLYQDEEVRVISNSPRITMREVLYTETSVHNFIFAKGELIVIAANWYTYEMMEALMHHLGGEIVGYLEVPNTFQIYFPTANEADLQDLQRVFEALPFFRSVTFNLVI